MENYRIEIDFIEISQISIIKRQKEALTNFFTYESRLKRHINRVRKQVLTLLTHKKRLCTVYNVIAKKDAEVDLAVVKKAIFHSADAVKKYSTVCLLRESGFLEI